MTRNLSSLKEHVFCRCGQAVSSLCDAQLVSRPQPPSSETEIHEWWLVSAELADRLRTAGLPVLQFHELHMWGRTVAGTPLRDDLDLVGALAAVRAPG